MNIMNINDTILTDGGEYTVVAILCEHGTDASIGLCVGRAADGHHDLIATDNATNWLVGDEDDADNNREQWDLIAERCGDVDMDAIRAIDADLADWLIEREAEANASRTKRTVYEIWIVENGSLTEFGRGWPIRRTALANMEWGEFDTLDEVRERFRELANENFLREDGPYDRIWGECAAARPDEADEGFSEPDVECRKYCDECAEALSIEWHDDLKWVRVREMVEDGNGNREFVRVLP